MFRTRIILIIVLLTACITGLKAQNDQLSLGLRTGHNEIFELERHYQPSFIAECRHYPLNLKDTPVTLLYSQTTSGNMPIEESFSLVLQGHDHYREELVYENVNYTVVGAIADKCKSPEYLKIEVTPEKLIFEWHQISDLH